VLVSTKASLVIYTDEMFIDVGIIGRHSAKAGDIVAGSLLQLGAQTIENLTNGEKYFAIVRAPFQRDAPCHREKRGTVS